MKSGVFGNLRSKLLIAAAIIAWIVVTTLLFDETCPFYGLFGIRCPGCGMTRAALCVLRGDLAGAWEYHAMFWSLPLLFGYFLTDGNLFGRIFPKGNRIDRILLAALGVGFLANWIVKF